MNDDVTRLQTVSSHEDKEKILTIIMPRSLPGWRIQASLSHSKFTAAQWLINKAILRNLSKVDQGTLRILGSQLPDSYFVLIKFILSDKFQESEGVHRQQIIPIIQKSFSFHKISRDYLLSFTPSVRVFKVWTKRRSLKPKRFVGVGYNDHGHLSSLPSWKDQILYTDDTGSKCEPDFLLDDLQRAFRLTPEEWQSRYSP
jgi:hypothetical protein